MSLLLERDDELAALRARVRGGALVLVLGEAGAGKTALVREFAGGSAAPVRWGACEALRYMVQRTFPDGLDVPATADGAAAMLGVVEKNAQEGVTWVHSYVTGDKKRTFCVYDGPTPQAIRVVAARNGLPVDGIDEVRVLDPYFSY